MRKIFVHDFTYFNAVVWKRISTLHLRLLWLICSIWMRFQYGCRWQWFGRKQRKHMAHCAAGREGWRMIWLRPKFRAYFWLNLLPAELWCGRGAICSVQNHCMFTLYSTYSTLYTILSTVSLAGLNTAGQELDIDEVNIKVAASEPSLWAGSINWG